LRIFPLQAQVDGGRYSGDITFEGSGKVPSLSVDEHLSGVDMGRLLATQGRKVHLSGTGDFSVKAQGSGASTEAMLHTLTGHVEARLVDGAVEGVDLGYDLNRAESLIERGAAPVPDTGRTRFDVFKTTADITNGIARTSDLAISSPVLHISGQGSTDLSTKGIDFALVAEPILSSGTAIQVPVKVTGTTADPTIRPDLAAMAKGQLGQKLKDVLHDKLQGLFGKP
jgi:AsmA protein